MTREIYTQATRRMLDIATETITKAIGDIAGQASGSTVQLPYEDRVIVSTHTVADGHRDCKLVSSG